MRLQYPSSVRIIRVPCTGKVDLVHILRAFEKGIDGLCVIGCLEGECHFLTGNIRARKRVEQARNILDKIAIGGERVQMFNVSSSEAPQFAKIIEEMTQKIIQLGPNPVRKALLKKQAA